LQHDIVHFSSATGLVGLHLVDRHSHGMVHLQVRRLTRLRAPPTAVLPL